MRALVNKIVAKGQSETSKAPTVAMLLQPRTSRTFSREVEEWLLSHDVAVLLEGLTTHLLRTLPHDELEESDKWLDSQKVSKVSTTTVIPKDDLSLETIPLAQSTPGFGHMVAADGLWQSHCVTCLIFPKHPLNMASGLTRAHAHRVACMTATAPQLSTVVHDNVLPTFGHWVNEVEVALVHQRFAVNNSAADILKALPTHVTLRWILTMIRDVLAGLGHLHMLGFLHRNLTLHSIFQLPGGSFVVGGLDFTVRSSRGRITSPSWAPRVAAPETLQTRTFDASSDIFAVGVMMLEACGYGSTVSFPLPSSRPSHVPKPLWTIAASCTGHAHSRPTCTALSSRIQEALELIMTKDDADCVIPLPLERERNVTTDLLSGLQRAGCATDISVTSAAMICGVTAEHWPVVQEALKLNVKLESVSLDDVVVGPSGNFEISVPVASICLKKIHADPRSERALFDNIVKALTLSRAQLRELRLVDMPWLSRSGLLDELVTSLASLAPMLEVLYLCGVELRSEALRALQMTLWPSEECAVRQFDVVLNSCTSLLPGTPLPNLRTIAIGGGDVLTSHGMGFLCAALQRDHRVRELVMDYAAIDYFAFGLLGQLLRLTSHLERISLVGVTLSPCSRRLLENGLRASSKHIDLVLPS